MWDFLSRFRKKVYSNWGKHYSISGVVLHEPQGGTGSSAMENIWRRLIPHAAVKAIVSTHKRQIRCHIFLCEFNSVRDLRLQCHTAWRLLHMDSVWIKSAWMWSHTFSTGYSEWPEYDSQPAQSCLSPLDVCAVDLKGLFVHLPI